MGDESCSGRCPGPGRDLRLQLALPGGVVKIDETRSTEHPRRCHGRDGTLAGCAEHAARPRRPQPTAMAPPPPGTQWSYSDLSADLLAAVLHRATGVQADEYAALHLFAPRGITHWSWDRGKTDGFPRLYGTLELRPRDRCSPPAASAASSSTSRRRSISSWSSPAATLSMASTSASASCSCATWGRPPRARTDQRRRRRAAPARRAKSASCAQNPRAGTGVASGRATTSNGTVAVACSGGPTPAPRSSISTVRVKVPG